MRQAATAADVSVAVMWWRASLFVLLCSIFTGGVLGQGGTGQLPECTIQVVGSKEIVAATSLQAKRTVNTLQQSASTPLLAKVDCVGNAPVTLTGGIGFAGFTQNYTGVNFIIDDTLPGAILKIEGQSLVIRDSLFTNLAHGADATVIAINSSLTIQNTTFASNSQAAAGALFLNGSSAVIYDSLFDHNRGFQAGGIYTIGDSSLLVNLTVFRSNNGSQGGGIGMKGSGRLRVINSLFLRNTAQNGGGVFAQKIKEAVITDCSFYDNVVAVNGGGMFQEDTSGSLNNCMFKGNKALTGAGGYYNTCPDISFTHSHFENNTASAGGAGLELNQCKGNVNICTFVKNKGEKGGGLFMDQCQTEVTNSSFDSNSASLLGGGLYRSFPHDRSVIRSCRFLKNKAGQYGGAIYEQNVADGLVQGCRFTNNQAPTAPSIYSRMSSTTFGSNINLDPADIEYADH